MFRIAAVAILLSVWSTASPQGFDIVWRQVALARTSAPGAPPVVQRTAATSSSAKPSTPPDTLRIERVSVEPSIINTRIGALFCISQLDIAAFTDKGERAVSVPLVIDMQLQHLRQLNLSPKSDDVCFKPQQPGEYAIRFSSRLPAKDGTLRGAQAFVRVTG